MATEKNKNIEAVETVEVENDYILRFNKPYTFDDEVYNEVDLSGIEDITAADMIAAQKVMSKFTIHYGEIKTVYARYGHNAVRIYNPLW